MSKQLSIWWGGKVAGFLHLNHYGDMGFSYAPEWLEDADAPALSFSLPKQVEPFGRRVCHSFFGGILPEEGQRSAIARALGVSAGNEFQLLEHLGGEVAGALMLLPEGQLPPAPASGTPDILDDEHLLQLLQHLPMRPMLAGEGGLRLSLAGAQSKLPVLLIDDHIALPAPGQPTSHILKPPIARFEQTTENEYYCMTLAREIGLDVASVTMRRVQDQSFLLIERYDRTRDADGRLVRLHQEDFAQALGVPSQRKYASEGGPTFKDSFALLRQAATRPARDILKLADAAIFNLIIGNADAHAKNFSLLHIDGAIRLAPLYDLLSTVAYRDLSPKLAMKIAKKATLEEIESRHWDQFAEDVNIGAPYLRRRIRQLCEATLAQLDAPDSSLKQRLPGSENFVRFADLIADRARRLLIKAG
ncbi:MULTISPECIES: type II toxin-antitoxin system HipA family toxin [unclassified Sphingobium]|uniref:type II toxin-antitoxin system HipA family toxin n=1 Tax=unclassified Sphingobium TaxID=2611147 RepID=UPI000D15FC8C|nr:MULTISPECIES: type II toxin-antitoxin system HipA family toxin [unclassified Sphingobium]MBG6118186.1 serine/threonine-protein kinase HipA [Sphingobium sp. JAI105]PSO09998.1 kinase [Sphingobium sp. AEW4]TWC98313.1 serine/threonine-protein kinase HipA [Sphingobium sp. AEW010]TWD18275.1 serine/threonine-protein kinase HipA [Sphingobium sp. AEW013]TWD20810.1 serine/threonine-protein kinase HipA [Sphingobium sp. AEW001]